MFQQIEKSYNLITMSRKRIIGRAKPAKKAQYQIDDYDNRRGTIKIALSGGPGPRSQHMVVVEKEIYRPFTEEEFRVAAPNLTPAVWVPKGYESIFNRFSEYQKMKYKMMKSKSDRLLYLKRFRTKQKRLY